VHAGQLDGKLGPKFAFGLHVGVPVATFDLKCKSKKDNKKYQINVVPVP
jgi:hypothetical protein